MSFYPQPHKYQCGPFALKYALVMLGRFESEKSIAKKAGSNWWYGTDEIGLARAAKHYKCRMKYFRRETPQDAIKALTQQLRKVIPAFLLLMIGGIGLLLLTGSKANLLLLIVHLIR